MWQKRAGCGLGTRLPHVLQVKGPNYGTEEGGTGNKALYASRGGMFLRILWQFSSIPVLVLHP